jgi:hypothetical protein
MKMNFLRGLFALPEIWFEANAGGGSGSGSGTGTDPTVQQLQQQVTEIQAKYEALHQKVEKGELIEPATFIKKATESGELYSKDRYVGLQKTMQTEKDAADALKVSVAALTANETALKTQLSNLEKEKGDLNAKLVETGKTVEDLTRKNKRSALIMEKFPVLAPFEVKGLLPIGDDTQLETLLSNFAGQLDTMTTKAKDEFGKGGGTKTPAGKETTTTPDGELDAKGLLAKAQAALNDTTVQDFAVRRANYDKFYDQYIAKLQQDAVT